jgi:hypothetical protein
LGRPALFSISVLISSCEENDLCHSSRVCIKGRAVEIVL